MAGGLAGPALLAVLGATADLLIMAAGAAAMFLGLVVATRRRYPAELSVVEHGEEGAERPTLRTLSRNRYVLLIVAFQMLSAIESQWLDFLVFERAAQRYDDSSELARFISRFSAIAYGTDILFLLVLAGLLLRRFGLRYGLTANAVAVLTVLGAVVVASSIGSSSATIVFVLIVAARVTDLTFSDGTSRTSLSAAYQAVPNRLRAVAQATVEGLAVPVAIGISGVGLLAVEWAGGADGLMLPVLTSVVVVAWIVVASLLYREYRTNLLKSLRGRILDPADLAVEGESSLIAIDRLVGSDDERDVRLGLDLLTTARHPELPARLQRLVVDERVNVRTDALERLVHLAPQMAAVAARAALDDPSADVRAASIRVLGVAGTPTDLARIAACSNDVSIDVKVAVAFALTRMGDDAVRADVASEISRLVRSDSPCDRTLAALMLGEHGPGTAMDRTPLRALLSDSDSHVVNAALAACRLQDDTDLLAEVVRRLDNRRTAGAAVDALVRGGDAALVVVDEGLGGGELSRRTQELLVRIGREIAGSRSTAVLRRHVEHRDREVGLAVMSAVAALGPSGADDRALSETTVVAEDLEHATHVLRALVAFADEASATMLCDALRDELDLLRKRVLAALSMRHGTEGLSRVVFQLAQRDARSHALALEWLDATLTGTDRAVVALLEPGLSDRDRMDALIRRFRVAPLDRRGILHDLAEDGDERWRRPWIAACAIYAASEMPDVNLREIADVARAPVALRAAEEDHIVTETLDGILRRRSARS